MDRETFASASSEIPAADALRENAPETPIISDMTSSWKKFRPETIEPRSPMPLYDMTEENWPMPENA